MDPQPTIGRIVVYRNRAGVDVPAIITSVTIAEPASGIPVEPGRVHLTQFPPPGQAADLLSHQHGVVYEPEPHVGCWRWPVRTS